MLEKSVIHFSKTYTQMVYVFLSQSSVRTCLNRFLTKSILTDICLACSKTNRHLNWNTWTRFWSVDTEGRLRMRCYTLKNTTVDCNKMHKSTQKLYKINSWFSTFLTPRHPFVKDNIWSSVAKSWQVFLWNWATLTLFPGCFSCPQVEATPIMWYLAPGMRLLPGEPCQKMCILPPGIRFLPEDPPWKAIGLLLG